MAFWNIEARFIIFNKLQYFLKVYRLWNFTFNFGLLVSIQTECLTISNVGELSIWIVFSQIMTNYHMHSSRIDVLILVVWKPWIETIQFDVYVIMTRKILKTFIIFLFHVEKITIKKPYFGMVRVQCVAHEIKLKFS